MGNTFFVIKTKLDYNLMQKELFYRGGLFCFNGFKLTVQTQVDCGCDKLDNKLRYVNKLCFEYI